MLVLLAAAAALSAASEYAPKYGVRRNITSTEGARKREGKGEERRREKGEREVASILRFFPSDLLPSAPSVRN